MVASRLSWDRGAALQTAAAPSHRAQTAAGTGSPGKQLSQGTGCIKPLQARQAEVTCVGMRCPGRTTFPRCLAPYTAQGHNPSGSPAGSEESSRAAAGRRALARADACRAKISWHCWTRCTLAAGVSRAASQAKPLLQCCGQQCWHWCQCELRHLEVTL